MPHISHARWRTNSSISKTGGDYVTTAIIALLGAYLDLLITTVPIFKLSKIWIILSDWPLLYTIPELN